jgi:maleylacetate reductase
MNDPRTGLVSGIFHIQAQERIVFGVPAGEAVVAEAERVGARRVFVTSTRSLAQKQNGPLQRMERALGARHVGSYSAIKSHSPREDVVAGAKAAREARADLFGGGGRRLGHRRHQGHAIVPLGRPR